jgi:hypothetical protein
MGMAVARGWREVPTLRAQFLGERKNENLAFNVKNYNGQVVYFVYKIFNNLHTI